MKPIQLIIKHLKIWLVLILLFTSLSFAQEKTEPSVNPVEYFGKLNTELSPDLEHIYNSVFEPVTDLSKYKFAKPVEKDAVVTVGKILDPRKNSGARLEILLVEPKDGAPYFYSD